MKTTTEILDRIEGNELELDAFLDPRARSTLKAADRQGWISALKWVLEMDEDRDKRRQIKEQYQEDVSTDTDFRLDHDEQSIVVNEDTELFFQDSRGDKMVLDHSSDMDGYVAFTNMSGENVTVNFSKVNE